MKRFLMTAVSLAAIAGGIMPATGCVTPIGDDLPDQGQNDNANGDGQNDQPNNDDPNEQPNENDNGQDEPNDEPLGDPKLVGVWEFQAGIFENNFRFPQLRMELREDGTISVYRQNPITKMSDVEHGFFIDFGTGLIFVTLDYTDSLEFMQVIVDDESLQFVSPNGETTDYIRSEDPVPDELKLQKLAIVNEFRDLPAPQNNTNLVFDGTYLVYTGDESNMELSFDLNDGTVGAPQDLVGNAGTVQAFDGEGFWAMSTSDSIINKRITVNVDLDKIDFDNDLAQDGDAERAAINPDDDVLWVLFESDADNKYRLLKIDVAADPNVLLEAVVFDHRLEGMVFHDGFLWAIATSPSPDTIVKIDPVTLQVVTNYAAPIFDVDMEGLASTGDRLFLLTEEFTDGKDFGVIYELSERTDVVFQGPLAGGTVLEGSF